MVDERTAYWGARDAARYRTRDDDPTGGDFVVAETLDANGDPVDVLLRWDDTAGEWVSGGPVNMTGEDVTNVGALDADSVSTGSLTNDQNSEQIAPWTESMFVLRGSGFGMSDAIPSGSSEPLKNALNAATDVKVLLPTGFNGGNGPTKTITGSSVIEGVSDATTIASRVDQTFVEMGPNVSNAIIEEFSINGNDEGPNAVAFDLANGPRGLKIRSVTINKMAQSINNSDSGRPYECTFGDLWHFFCDGGDKPALVDLDPGGPANSWGIQRFQSQTNRTGQDSNCMRLIGGGHSIEAINAGKNSGYALKTGGNAKVQCDYINYERNKVGVSTHNVCELGGRDVKINSLHVLNSTVNNVYRVDGLNKGRLAEPIVRSNSTVNGDIIRIDSDVSGTILYEGSSSDVNNTFGTLTGTFRCLADNTTV